MLIEADKSCLLVIDVQEKLYRAVHGHEQLVENCSWLMKLANILEVSTLISEQYPQGLGGTIEELKSLSPSAPVMDKTHFSCMASPTCQQHILDTQKDHIIIVGMEAHVCVLQTVMLLLAEGKQVFVVADAISSRNPNDAQLGIERMRDAGAHIVTKEMVFFEWVHRSDHPKFRQLSKDFLQ